ncbi:MAG: helix-turn-helix domain-containing protein [Prevotella sp.]|nr:helix-turn-helix domain-containing protein [Prevotella sp.]
MKDRIRQIMESQHMTQQVFADFIELSPATLSSIFNGRTRPTLSVVDAIKKKIPNINIEWLLWGTGEMFQTDAPAMDSSDIQETDNPGYHQSTLNFDQNPPMVNSAPTPSYAAPTNHNFNSVRNTHIEMTREDLKTLDKPSRRVIEIRVFYDDQTWDTFVPAKK